MQQQKHVSLMWRNVKRFYWQSQHWKLAQLGDDEWANRIFCRVSKKTGLTSAFNPLAF